MILPCPRGHDLAVVGGGAPRPTISTFHRKVDGHDLVATGGGAPLRGPCFPGVGDPVPDLILHSPGPVLAPSWGRAPSQHGRPPVMEPLPAEFACPWGRVHAGHDGEG